MPIESQEVELLQAARCEDLPYQQIRELTIVGEFERKVVDILKQVGAHLVEGARGVGKSMLLRLAEIELDAAFDVEKKIGVYVNFKTSTLLEGVKAGERDAFQIWVNLKILQSLHEKLSFLNLIGKAGESDPYLRLFDIPSVAETKMFLEEKIHLLQKLAFAKDRTAVVQELGPTFLDKVRDTGYLVEIVRAVVDRFNLARVVFLFDEAAHTFIPAQQEIFFEIFKLLHGNQIACKAAVYPTVTSYGRNFEVGQDAIVVSIDRYEPGTSGREANRSLFRSLLEKRIPAKGSLHRKIFSKGELLDNCIDLSTGNPRAFLHLLNRAIDGGFNEYAISLSAQSYVDQELLPYHTNLAKRLPKYAHHVRVGLDLLRGYIIPEIRKKNHKAKVSGYQSAFFTISRDLSPNLKLALDLLCYSGVLISKGTVKIAGRKTGLRYMVNLSLLTTEKAFVSAKLSEAFAAISLTDYREFSESDSQIETYLRDLKEADDTCAECSASLPPNAKFCSNCGSPLSTKPIITGLLEESVRSLSLSEKLAARVAPHYPRVGDVVQAKRSEIMKIKFIKEVRSRIVKNAADEFISG